MKQKKFNKKLSLNKKTIANLNYGEKGHVLGGAQWPTTGSPCLVSCEKCPTMEIFCTDDPTCPDTCTEPSGCSAAGNCC